MRPCPYEQDPVTPAARLSRHCRAAAPARACASTDASAMQDDVLSAITGAAVPVSGPSIMPRCGGSIASRNKPHIHRGRRLKRRSRGAWSG